MNKLRGSRRTTGAENAAFTLLEVLIIIVLAGIMLLLLSESVKRFRPASQLARVKAELFQLGIATESYAFDWSAYPPNEEGFNDLSPSQLTTPIAYVGSVTMPDAYATVIDDPSQRPSPYTYLNTSSEDVTMGFIYDILFNPPWQPAFEAEEFIWMSVGPDRKLILDEPGGGFIAAFELFGTDMAFGRAMYDPTNGTKSRGDVILTSRGMLDEILD